MMKRLYFSVSAVALLSTVGAVQAHAAAADTVQEVIVTGTRTTGLKAVDSAAPIQVLDAGALKRVGQTDLIQALSQNVPSFTAQALGGDAANLTLSAKLRGLSPNDALVLINGKRRHGTANLAVLGGPYQGGASADLNFIPISSIDHVEVLTDGAAAQYGTDAIAGVVNIILKKANHGGSVTAGGGSYFDQGGDTVFLTGNIGLAPLGEKSWLNVTAESKFHGHSDRGNVDPRVYNHDGRNNVGAGGPYALALAYPGYPNVNHIHGDALYHLTTVSYDTGYEFDGGTTLYSFGTYGHKNGQAFENYRTPDKAPAIYPLGFTPKEELFEDDFAFTVGVKGKLFGWNVDLSSTYGSDNDDFYTEGTANNDASKAPPVGINLRQTNFYDGTFIATQWTSNLDLSRDFAVGMASPLSVAFGIEQRHDTYELVPGEPNSYSYSGAASFPGLPAVNAGKHGRDNTGVYLDLALSPVEKLKLDGAVRFEHFSDFGDTTVYKLTGRYDFTPAIAVRGTVSTGFRAPTLAEEYYSNLNVGPHTAYGQFGPNSAGAASLGFSNLKPEKSDNYSVGLVVHPFPKVTGTLDVYQIKLKDRIVGSGNINGLSSVPGVATSAAVQAALIAFVGPGPLAGATDTGINIFANGLDTKTDGVDAVLTYSETYGEWGKVDWSLTASYNKTKVTKIKASPATIAPQTLYDPIALSYLTDASPEYKIIAGAFWTYKKFTFNLRETLFGPSSELGIGDDGNYYRSNIKSTPVMDLEMNYMLKPDIKLTLGANNLLNEYPQELNAQMVASYRIANDNAAVAKYPDWSPFGFNGGYYYGKVTFSF